MPISFKSLLKTPPCWMRQTTDGKDHDSTVLMTVVRMVRNLPGHCFPGWSTAEDRAAVAEKILPALRSHPLFRYAHRAEMTDLNREHRLILLERKQITPGMAARQDGCHLLISRNQKIIAMVNEEEHLCVHVGTPGLNIANVLDDAQELSRHLESKHSFARNAKGAYLTSMPSEAGEGLQLFAMLHLPAMSMCGQMEKIRNALEKMNLNLSPFTAEADDCGNLYVLFTQPIPQGEVTAAVDQFSHICSALDLKERRMSDLEFEREDGPDPIDLIYRAYGMLRYAHSLDYKELLCALSLMRLGLQHYLLAVEQEGSRKFAMPPEILRLYELSPAVVRYSCRQLQNARDARAYRSDVVRAALRIISPVLSV